MVIPCYLSSRGLTNNVWSPQHWRCPADEFARVSNWEGWLVWGIEESAEDAFMLVFWCETATITAGSVSSLLECVVDPDGCVRRSKTLVVPRCWCKSKVATLETLSHNQQQHLDIAAMNASQALGLSASSSFYARSCFLCFLFFCPNSCLFITRDCTLRVCLLRK